MKHTPLYHFDRWLYRRFESIRLHQLSYFSIWFILVFTVLFSLLVIHEEYKQFTSTINKQRESYILKEHELMHTTAYQIEQIMNFASNRHNGKIDRDFFKLIAVFNESSYQFIALYDRDMNLIEQSVVVDTLPLEHLHISDGKIFEATIDISDNKEEVLLLSRNIVGEYHLVIGHYLKPFHMQLKEQGNALKHRLIRLVLEIATLSFILFGFMMGISKVFSSMLERDVASFLDFFTHAKEHYHVMNPRTAFFKEFKNMARGANDMVHTIEKQKNELKELNLTLEERVKNKTTQLQELLDSQQQFVRYAIHETNTPLSVMITNIELYNMKNGRNNYLAKVEASVKQIFNIYDDLSFLVKKNQIEYPKLEIDLSGYLQSRIHFFDEVAQLATLKFEFINSCKMPTSILLNETKLQRIIDNNLTNAIKYTKRNEVIEVTLEEDTTAIYVIFASHSIPIKDTKKIFEAYYREKKENHYRDGFGLGLNLVKSICDEEGIEITLHSNQDKTEFQYKFKRIIDENTAS